jgi:hypothetical protein
MQHAGNDALDLGIVEANLGLRFELRLGHRDANHGGYALAKILASGLEVVLEKIVLLAVRVEGARQGGAEAGQVRAAAGVVGVVGIAADAFLVARGVLKGDFDADVIRLLVDVENFVESFLGAVDPFDEFRDAARVGKSFFAACERIGQLDGRPLVEKGQLAQAIFQGVVIELGLLENFRVGVEGDLGAGAVAGAAAEFFDFGGGPAAFVFLDINLATAANLGLGPIGQRGDGLGSHPV